ncbi:hypothetical protein H8B02_16750 [Bradyrhizobium sp. Pear77]|uniref:hypothetical protein n=1 Tax=Bradyrhizobium altum TaxID=1571202 RepID=UPI001E334D6A|nr:hypothetical protein [Bradyrhizobium altum]MCC8955029.1 hypothetical protein [Bradyrhizobium altum]
MDASREVFHDCGFADAGPARDQHHRMLLKEAVRFIDQGVARKTGTANGFIYLIERLLGRFREALIDRTYIAMRREVNSMLLLECRNDRGPIHCASRASTSGALRQAFIVYLLSHDRPMSEVLAPTRKNIEDVFKHGFMGMTRDPVELADLLAARTALIRTTVGDMPDDHRKFLISFEKGQPNWDLLGVPDAADLPAVLWRQQNLDELSQNKRAILVARLEEVLSENV